VKETIFAFVGGSTLAEDVLQNGVKETIECDWNIPKYVINEVVNDGVKYTFPNSEMGTSNDVEDTLKNGVKQTYSLGSLEVTEKEINNTLQSGVKETKQKKNALLILDTSGRELILESHLVVRDGVKETSHRQYLKTYDVKDTIQDGTEHDRWILDGCDDPVDVVLDNGVKITAPLESREYTGDIDEVLGNGVRNSHPLQYRTKDMIDKVIDKGIKETHDDVYHHKGRIDGVIKNGVKETHREICEYKNTIDYIVQTGVKETAAAGYTDPKTNLLHIKWGDQIDDVIDNGIKEVVSYDEHKRGPVNTFGYIDDIIKEGEKINGTYAGGQRQSEKCKSVVEYGIKTPTD
jgi:predicted peroxiredoxin